MVFGWGVRLGMMPVLSQDRIEMGINTQYTLWKDLGFQVPLEQHIGKNGFGGLEFRLS